jgi:hypothetical protein
MPTYTCPACGYLGLEGQPWTIEGAASDEICPSCGLHFGFDDAVGGDESLRAPFHRGWGARWRANGARWWSSRPMPQGWDGEAQYRRHTGSLP